MDDIANDKNSPTAVPVNEFTLMIEAVAARNRSGVALTPEQIASGVPIMGTPLPSARSADLGRASTPVVPVPPPLSQEQIDELNRRALAAGIHPSQIPGLDATEDMGPYATLEAAIAAGAPVGAEPEAVAIGARKFREVAPTFPQGPLGKDYPRMTAREFIASRAETQLPRLPDFKKVQMIDLVNSKIYVDGLEFDCTATELKMLRKFAVNKAKEQIEASLNAALKALAEDDGGGTEAVS